MLNEKKLVDHSVHGYIDSVYPPLHEIAPTENY